MQPADSDGTHEWREPGCAKMPMPTARRYERREVSMSSMWCDVCQQCGSDLPLSAPANQKFCSPQCRTAAYQVFRSQSLADRYEQRRQERLDAKAGRAPCIECGEAIAASRSALAKFCSSTCQSRAYSRRLAQEARAARLSERSRQRATRRESANGGAGQPGPKPAL